jgi:hypothetical protein
MTHLNHTVLVLDSPGDRPSLHRRHIGKAHVVYYIQTVCVSMLQVCGARDAGKAGSHPWGQWRIELGPGPAYRSRWAVASTHTGV